MTILEMKPHPGTKLRCATCRNPIPVPGPRKPDVSILVVSRGTRKPSYYCTTACAVARA